MTHRREQIYVSTDVLHSLWLIAKAAPSRLDDQGFPHLSTPDEKADELLRAAIKEKWPQLLEHQKTIDKLEKELLEKLK